MSEIKHQYFTVDGTALTIPKRGANAIYCGDAPRKNTDGTTSHSLRAPLLIMPPDMFSSEVETLEMIAQALNENASLFYPSANKEVTPTLSAAMELPEVRALVETAQWARNRLEIIADESWHGDGRDLKRSIIGIFADFDKALADCGSQVPLALAAIKEPKT